MRAELPEVRRCCFCFPLRHGVLVIGLLKILVAVLFLTWHISSMPKLFSRMAMIVFVLCACLILDSCCSVAYLISECICMKNERIKRMFFVVCIVMQCTVGLLFLWRAGEDVVKIVSFPQNMAVVIHFFCKVLCLNVVAGIVWSGCQTYMIILIKNEIKTLNKNAKSYRFTNNELTTEEAVDSKQTLENPDHATDNEFIDVNNQSQNTRVNVNCNEPCDENVVV